MPIPEETQGEADGLMLGKSWHIVGFIPGRAESTRFPGKPLADILGKPMIVRVLERAERCPLLEAAYVATDSQEILEAVQSHGGKALLTARAHASGTDRIAQAARECGLTGNHIVVNIQGDQPLFDPVMIDEVVQPLLHDPAIPMSTLIYRIVRHEEISDPNAVKTAMDSEGFALYFSRATIPCYRDSSHEPSLLQASRNICISQRLSAKIRPTSPRIPRTC